MEMIYLYGMGSNKRSLHECGNKLLQGYGIKNVGVHKGTTNCRIARAEGQHNLNIQVN